MSESHMIKLFTKNLIISLILGIMSTYECVDLVAQSQVYHLTASTTENRIRMTDGTFATDVFINEHRVVFPSQNIDFGFVQLYDIDLINVSTAIGDLDVVFSVSIDSVSYFIRLNETNFLDQSNSVLAQYNSQISVSIGDSVIEFFSGQDLLVAYTYDSSLPTAFQMEFLAIEGDFTIFERTLIDEDFGLGVVFVDQNAHGLNDGTSWENAYIDLQDALWLAQNDFSHDTILVAQGQYFPGVDRTSTFEIKESITILGGFPTGGSPYSVRNPYRYYCFLDGDIGALEDPADNVYHVISLRGFQYDIDLELDGLVVQNGNADGSLTNQYGGGIYFKTSSTISPNISLTNIIFRDNYGIKGGGLSCQRGIIYVNNCQFYKNSGKYGGAIYVDQSSLSVTTTGFQYNRSEFGNFIFSEDRSVLESN